MAGDWENKAIVYTQAGSQKPFCVIAVDTLPDLHLVGAAAGSEYLPFYRYDEGGNRVENITDWSLKQFQQHYQLGRGKKTQPITKEDIFHYVYAVLHNPIYREKYATNLKRSFQRIPFYGEVDSVFRQWAALDAELMAIHIGYEAANTFLFTRVDVPETRAIAAGQPPKGILKSNPESRRIVFDSETVLTNIPHAAWDNRLGNRSAIDWVLDQHKETKPKDPTIRERFDTYRLADYKEEVIDRLARVTTVSMETISITKKMQYLPR